MPAINFKQRIQARNQMVPRAGGWLALAITLLAGFGWLAGPSRGVGAENAFTEYQVKALFLLNFTKYVDWPTTAFAATNTPITIGVYGENKFGEALQKVIEGRIVYGRKIIIQSIAKDGDPGKCHVLFISNSERAHLGEILDKVRALPVLTVGESDQFLEQGGVINFVKKNGKVRLEINLDATRQAGLEISSRLLSVADVVKGKLK